MITQSDLNHTTHMPQQRALAHILHRTFRQRGTTDLDGTESDFNHTTRKPQQRALARILHRTSRQCGKTDLDGARTNNNDVPSSSIPTPQQIDGQIGIIMQSLQKNHCAKYRRLQQILKRQTRSVLPLLIFYRNDTIDGLFVHSPSQILKQTFFF